MTTQFPLLNDILKAQTPIEEGVEARENQYSTHINHETMRVPEEVLKSLRTRIAEMKKAQEKRARMFDRDRSRWLAQGSNDESDSMRLPIGFEPGLELNEMLLNVLSQSNLSYDDVKRAVTEMYAYNNLARADVPSDVLKFIHVTWKWNQNGKRERKPEPNNQHPDIIPNEKEPKPEQEFSHVIKSKLNGE